MEYRNYIKIDRMSLGYRYYCIIDTDQHLADQLFIDHKVTVRFMQEFVKEDTKYKFIFCKVHRYEDAEFLLALDELKEKMIHMGHMDYPDFCRSFTDRVDLPLCV